MHMANKHFYNDQPSTSDLLGAEAYVLALLKTIDWIGEDSFSIWITADWGNWKSTILKLLKEKLWGEESKILYVPINLWQYKGSDNIVDIFFTELSRVYTERQKFKWSFKKFWFLILSILKQVLLIFWTSILIVLLVYLFKPELLVTTATASLVSLSLLVYFFKKEVDIPKLIQEIDKEYSKYRKEWEISNYEEFSKRKTIRDKIDILVGLITKEQIIVVWVDEIDRCPRDMIIQSLDSIRLFLGRNKCIFLLAYDEKVVENAVREKLMKAKWKSEDFLAKRYLEKIIDLVIPIWGFGDYQINNFAQNLQDCSADYWVIESFKEILEQVDASGKIVEAESWIGSHLKETPIRNPRTLKRVMNLFKFHVIYFAILEDFGMISELKYDALLRITLLKITFGNVLKSYFECEHDYNKLIELIELVKNVKELQLDEYELDEYEQSVLEYVFWRHRPSELSSYTFFQNYYNPKRINSLKVVEFQNLLKREKFNDGENIFGELIAFFKKEKREHMTLENQLCYYRYLTKWWKFTELLKTAKKIDTNKFAYLTSLYIYFFESYASFNSFKLDNTTYESFFEIMEEIAVSNEIMNFSSPLPLARYIWIISESKNYELLKRIVPVIFCLPDSKLRECLSFIKRNIKMTDELYILLKKWAKIRPEFKTLLDSTFTNRELYSNYVQKYRTLRSVEYHEKNVSWKIF